MSEKIDIDGVRFKVEADLSKLEGDLKKGEGVAKKGGENLGKAAGQGFASKLKNDTSEALKNIEGQASGMGGKIAGVFGKIGAAAAAAFAFDKVVDFFKDSMKYADEMQESMGGVSKEAKNIKADFDKLGNGGVWDGLRLKVGTFLNDVMTGLKGVAVYLADVFGGKSSDRIVELYKRETDSIKDLGNEIEKLSGINNRSATEELKLIDLKGKLSEKVKALGLDYDKLTASGKSYVEILQEMQDKAKLNAQGDLTDKSVSAVRKAQQSQSFAENTSDVIARMKANPSAYRTAGYNVEAEIAKSERNVLKFRADAEKYAAEAKAIQKQIDDIGKPEKASSKGGGGGGGGGPSGQEARFIDSRLRLETIYQNEKYTIEKAYSALKSGTIDKDEFERRKEMAQEEARQASEFEVGSLRAGYAQFIEETHMAKLEALNSEADNARRLSNNLLEADLKEAWGNEEELQELKEENRKRLAEIDEAKARKETALTLESFSKTMNAANATTTGFASIANARDAGGAIGGIGGTFSGISGVSDKFKGLGLLGSGISAAGGVIGTLTSLFGKSDEERQKEAAQQKERDEGARVILELQANYQRQQLEIAQANAKLPFENLTRQLRLVDIEAGKQRLAGVDEDTVNTNRLAARSKAIQGVLSSQAGAIGGGQLFGGQGASAEALTGFLNERASQAASVAGFMSILQAMSGPLSIPAIQQLHTQAQSYQGKIPAELFAKLQPVTDALSNLTGAALSGDTQQIQSALGGLFSAASTRLGSANSILSEIGSDTGIAENLLSVIEQQQQTDLEIANNTKKTADNTTKLVETPQRQSSIIDISRGYTRSLGQVLSPGITNTALPSSIKAAVLATDIQKSIQERSLDKLQNIETIQRDSRELLAIIAKGVNSTASGSLLAELESLYRRSLAA